MKTTKIYSVIEKEVNRDKAALWNVIALSATWRLNFEYRKKWTEKQCLLYSIVASSLSELRECSNMFASLAITKQRK